MKKKQSRIEQLINTSKSFVLFYSDLAEKLETLQQNEMAAWKRVNELEEEIQKLKEKSGGV